MRQTSPSKFGEREIAVSRMLAPSACQSDRVTVGQTERREGREKWNYKNVILQVL